MKGDLHSMDIYDDNDEARALQEQFSRRFPYLKIEFFSKPHRPHRISPKEEQIERDEPLTFLRHGSSDAKVSLNGDRTVAQVEKEIWDVLGIAAQVYRRSGDLWVETSLTDDWTLKRQNKEGEAFSKLMLERRPMDQWQEDNRTDEE